MIIGMRSTDSLIPERRGSRKMTRRAQPYRRRRAHGRPMGPTLSAMLKGAPAYLPNPQDQHRKFIKSYGVKKRG
jgi:hypothetical protein